MLTGGQARLICASTAFSFFVSLAHRVSLQRLKTVMARLNAWKGLSDWLRVRALRISFLAAFLVSAI